MTDPIRAAVRLLLLREIERIEADEAMAAATDGRREREVAQEERALLAAMPA